MTEDRVEAPDLGLSTGERLLAGAAGMFREKGYAATTTRALSALLGIQNASLYHHIGGKEDLLYRLCIVTLDDVAGRFGEVLDLEAEPGQLLDLLARGYLDQALKDRDRHATMLTEIRSLSPARRDEVVARRDENVAIVLRLVASAQEAEQLRGDIDAKYLTLALFNLLNWSIFWFTPDGDLDRDELGRILSSVFFEGVATAPSPPTARSRSKSRDASSSRGTP
jgi:TetR/AcrR family transcriptional regulator, cholesterol catabolism regulator